MTAAVGHCWFCTEPVFGRVDAPNSHPCCDWWMGVLGFDRCYGCVEARRLRRGHVLGPVRIPARPERPAVAAQERRTAPAGRSPRALDPADRFWATQEAAS